MTSVLQKYLTRRAIYATSCYKWPYYYETRMCSAIHHLQYWHWNAISSKFSSLAAPEVVKMTTSGAPNDENIVETTFLSLVAPEVVKMTTSGAASGENFVEMTTFPFQWSWHWLSACRGRLPLIAPCLPTIHHVRRGYYSADHHRPAPSLSTGGSSRSVFEGLCDSQVSGDKNVHYSDVIMGAMASQLTSLTTVYSTVHSGADQRKYQSSASLAFVREIHRWPVNSPHKWPVTRKMFPLDDVIVHFKTWSF